MVAEQHSTARHRQFQMIWCLLVVNASELLCSAPKKLKINLFLIRWLKYSLARIHSSPFYSTSRRHFFSSYFTSLLSHTPSHLRSYYVCDKVAAASLLVLVALPLTNLIRDLIRFMIASRRLFFVPNFLYIRVLVLSCTYFSLLCHEVSD